MATAHDLSIYHRTDALLEMFTRLSDPSRCGSRLTVDNLRDAEDPSFQLRVATFADSHVRSTQAPVGAAHVLINFGAHGRELISSEVALRLAKMLCGEAPSRFAGDAERSRERIAELLRHVVVKFVPVQVPSARRLAEVGGGSCKQRRLNARGVDVNRNWDVQWTAGDGGEGSSQYRGPRPFSEPETRALARYAEEWRPDVFVDVRSGDRCIPPQLELELSCSSNLFHSAPSPPLPIRGSRGVLACAGTWPCLTQARPQDRQTAPTATACATRCARCRACSSSSIPS